MVRGTQRTERYAFLVGTCVGIIAIGVVAPSMVPPESGRSKAPLDGQPVTVTPSERANVSAVAAGRTAPGSATTDPAPSGVVAPGGAGRQSVGGRATADPSIAGHPSDSVAPRLTVGVLLLNIGNIARFGFGGGAGLSTEDQQRVWQAYIDDVNAAGGVHGRAVAPVYETYDVLSQDDMRRACLALTQDARVFLVLDGGGYTGPPVLCVTEENRTPFLLSGSSGVPNEYFRRSDGLLFTLFQAGERSMRNMVAELPRAGVAMQERIGILSDLYGGIKETPDQLQAALEHEGYDVVFRGDLSGDLQTGTTQIPITVQQMRSRGVEVVVNISNAVYATQFVQEASSQGWHPHYVSGDWNGGSTDFYMQNMPDSFEGNHTITGTRVNEGRAGRPEAPVDRDCTRRAETELGVAVTRDSDAYGMYLRLCSMVHILKRTLEEAGPRLTVQSFTTAAHRVGRLALAGFGGGSYAPGRADAIDHVRVIRWNASCTCQLPINDFRPTRH